MSTPIPLRMHAVASAVALYCACLLPAAVHAQTNSAPDAAKSDAQKAADANKTAATLPTVNVKATATDTPQVKELPSYKFTAPLLDTPRSITVIPEAVLEEQNITTFAEALRTIPGTSFLGAEAAANPDSDRPVMRGFEVRDSIYVDGMHDTGIQNRETFNVESISVMRGPDSVYAGRGAVGGSIDIHTKAPKADDFMNGSLGLGTADYRRATVDWNRQINDTTAFRLNVMAHDANKPGRSEVFNKRWGVAPSVAFGLGTPTTVTLSYYHLYASSMPDFGTPIPSTGGPPVDTPRGQFYGMLDRDYNHSRTDSGKVNIEHRINDTWKLRNSTLLGRSTMDWIGTLPQLRAADPGMIVLQGKNGYYATNTFSNQTEATGHLDLGGMRHTLTGGMQLTRQKGVFGGYLMNDSSGRSIRLGGNCAVAYNCTPIDGVWDPRNPWTGTIIPDMDSYPGPTTYSTTKIASLYLFDTVKLSERWLVNGGLRFEHFSAEAVQSGQPTLKNVSNFVDYQLGVVYKPVRAMSIYTSYGTSSNPPGAGNSGAIGNGDQLTRTNQDLKPERSRNIELGMKWDVLDERLSLTAAIFQNERTDSRVSDGLGGTINAGSQRVRGVELGASGRLTSKWSVFAGYTHLDAVTTNAGPAAAAGAHGLPMPMSPRNSFTLWTSYDVLPELTIGGGLKAQSMMYTSVSASARRYIPGYARFDLAATWRVSKSTDLRLNVYNVFDREYFQTARIYADWAPARSAVLTLTYRM